MHINQRIKRCAAIVAFPLFIAGILSIAVLYRGPLVALFRSPEAVRSWVDARGLAAPLAFMAIQVLQVVVFVIPGEIVQIGGGFAFGLWMGTLWSVLGILAGSLVNFALGRYLGRPFVLALFGEERLMGIERATASGKAAAGFFLLFAIPGIPKDALTYIAGASRLGLFDFIVISTLGRLPGIIGSAFMGSAVFDRDYRTAIVMVSIASVLFFLGLIFREKLHDLIARLVHRKGTPRE
ncbi:MAG: TVP38/TMEM64 family protein [Spirochaetales bacterium]|nr:MAG: TVP38/TMEM64 family protein [Spirochaetales bacterium]